jgi:hypothetical protein
VNTGFARNLERGGLGDDALRIAQGLMRTGRKRVGLLACPNDLDIERVAIAVGGALSALCEGSVALVDLCGKFRSGPAPKSECDGSVILGRWLSRSLAVLTPRESLRISGWSESLPCLLECAARSERVLVDLTGLSRTDALGAVELLDGTCVVGRAGRTREKELILLYRELLPSKDLGVILTDW